MYNRSWACPPAVGTVDACKERCLRYSSVLVISTIAEVSDISDLEQTLACRAPHEAITQEVVRLVRDWSGAEVMALSTEACAICSHCAWPGAPCRHPEKMFPCVESYGILVTALADHLDMEFFNGNLVTWYSLIFYHETENSHQGACSGG